MQSIQTFSSKISVLLTDIDDTLTDEGLLGPEAYRSLWELHNTGLHVVPVTGRPAGWCEMIARQWPVSGVVGENGAFYFRYHNKTMKRSFGLPLERMRENQAKLNTVREEILKTIPGTAVASDQFCRMNDLAIDFCEDVPPLPKSEIKKIVDVFEKHGAHAKVSSIHVNGWFGDFDKLSRSLQFLKTEFALSDQQIQSEVAFVGDSPNDEPMWKFFPHSFGVANVKNFLASLKHPPKYVADLNGGRGFEQIANRILALKK